MLLQISRYMYNFYHIYIYMARRMSKLACILEEDEEKDIIIFGYCSICRINVGPICVPCFAKEQCIKKTQHVSPKQNIKQRTPN